MKRKITTVLFMVISCIKLNAQNSTDASPLAFEQIQFAEEKACYGGKLSFEKLLAETQEKLHEFGYYTIPKNDPAIFALSIDPLAEKFPSMSPYNAMGNNPVNMIDPDGKEIVFAPNSSAEFIEKFKSEYERAKAAGCSEVLDKLQSSETIVYLMESSTLDNSFIPNIDNIPDVYLDEDAVQGTLEDIPFSINGSKAMNIISWNPNISILPVDNTGNTLGTSQSSLIYLIHESDHALRFIENPIQYILDTKTKVENYTTKEEERVIKGSETHAALLLGEGVRTNHKGAFSRADFYKYGPPAHKRELTDEEKEFFKKVEEDIMNDTHKRKKK